MVRPCFPELTEKNSEGSPNRVFKYQIINTNTNTATSCLTQCSNFGFGAGGMEYGQECCTYNDFFSDFLILPLLSSSFGQNMLSYRSSLRIARADVAGQTAVTPLTLQMPAQQSTLILTVMSLAAAIQHIFAVAEIEYHTILGQAHPSKSGPAPQAAALANIST
jgi:hypothetical protein